MAAIGIEFVAVGISRFMRVLTTAESAIKKGSQGFVDAAKTSLSYAQRQQSLAIAINKVKEAQDKNLVVHPAILVAIEKEKRALKLLYAEMRTGRADMVATTAEAGKFARNLYTISFAAGVASAALLKFSQVNLKTALSVEKPAIALEILTENTNAHREAVAAEIVELQNLNMTQGDATQMVARFMAARFDLTKASDVAEMGTHQSILTDLEAIEVIERMTDAIVNRTTRGLRDLDLYMRTNETFEDFAENLEIRIKDMSKSEQMEAIFNAILERTNVLMGVTNELWESGGGLLQIYHTQVKDLQATLGKGLLPSLIDVLKVANDFLEWLNKLPKAATDAIAILALLAGALAGVTTSTLMLVGLLRIAGLDALLAKIGTIATAITPAVGIAVLVLGALTIGISRVTKAIKDLKTAPLEDAIQSMERIFSGILKIPLIPRPIAEWIVRKLRELFDIVTDEAEKAGRDVGRAFIDAMVEEIDAQLRKIDIEATRLAEAFELEQAKATIVLVPLRLQELQIQRNIDKTQRLADAAEELAEGPLKNAQAQLKLLGDISKDLDRALLPYEHALKRTEAAAAEILIPLRAQERSLQRQLDLLERRIALERRSLENALRAAELSLRGIEDQVYALDKALWPLQDAFTQIRADADLVLIPLRRQQRAIERQIDSMTRLSEIEQERIERHLRALEKQRDALQEIIDVDRDRLELINHEIFMEQLRNRILQRVTSAGLLTMQSQSAVLQDQLDLRQEQMKALNEQTKDERERLQDVKDTLEEQLEPLKKRLQLILDAIAPEEERVLFAQEELRLEEARQAASRITLEQQRRLAEEEVEQARRRLEDFDELAIARTQALRDELILIGDVITREEERIQQARDELELARMRQTETRIALENAVLLWEDIRDTAQIHFDIIKETYDTILEGLKNELDAVGFLITAREDELKIISLIRDAVDATLKLEKDQLETRKKYLSILKEIQELPLIMKNGATGGATATPSAATIPTVPMPLPVPTPSITSQSSVVGPTIQLVAHYGKVQSIATIKDDVELMLSYAS